MRIRIQEYRKGFKFEKVIKRTLKSVLYVKNSTDIKKDQLKFLSLYHIVKT